MSCACMHAYAYILILSKFHSLACICDDITRRLPAGWGGAAVDAGYARRLLAACAALAVSPGGQARAGGRTDVKLLIALSDDTPGLRDVEPFSWCASVL